MAKRPGWGSRGSSRCPAQQSAAAVRIALPSGLIRAAGAADGDVESGGFGGRGRGATLSGTAGQAGGFGACAGVPWTVEGSAAGLACPRMLGALGCLGGDACSFGGQLGGFARDVGGGGTIAEVVGAVPGQDGAQQPDRLVGVSGIQWPIPSQSVMS
jgi:hypothetical protein